ncbi:DUF1850 domain-containing protein [Roseateles sp.]|uniref:DUF1850 domain-containing protein n=1 Tax=Roseateles sp. TaxID=1971397 RepID=UPI00326626EF
MSGAAVTVLGLCLALGGADAVTPPPGPAVFIVAHRFTLAWTHSIEHVRWEEDYELQPAPSGSAGAPPRLLAVLARVQGSAAGMEPGPDAVLRNGWFEYRPAQREHLGLWLTRSPYTADYELCLDGAPCRPLSAWLPSDGWRTRLWPCAGG